MKSPMRTAFEQWFGFEVSDDMDIQTSVAWDNWRIAWAAATYGYKLHILQHSLGLDQYGAGRQYRNHFVTGEGSDDFPLCRELVAEGLMTERAGNELSGGSPVFFVTRAGIDFVAKNSPAKPPEKKLTRSQRRYREWLRADCGLSFAEWIGAKA